MLKHLCMVVLNFVLIFSCLINVKAKDINIYINSEKINAESCIKDDMLYVDLDTICNLLKLRKETTYKGVKLKPMTFPEIYYDIDDYDVYYEWKKNGKIGRGRRSRTIEYSPVKTRLKEISENVHDYYITIDGCEPMPKVYAYGFCKIENDEEALTSTIEYFGEEYRIHFIRDNTIMRDEIIKDLTEEGCMDIVIHGTRHPNQESCHCMIDGSKCDWLEEFENED